jgi:glutathione synthase/RimK-type ligase-like ATP-grasp enzyme
MKNKKIIVGRNGRPSMRRTYATMQDGELTIRKLDVRTGKNVYRKYSDNNPDHVRFEDAETLVNTIAVRWGTREVLPTDSGSLVYNQAWSMKKASDKRWCREILDAAGVNIPKRITPLTVAPEDYPIIARPRKHQGGKHFVVLNNERQFLNHYHEHEPQGWYYSEFWDKEREFRCHVAHGKVLFVREKPSPGDGSKVWNHSQNHDAWPVIRWDHLNSTPAIAEACKQSIAAVKACNLDFGGVDVMIKGDEAKVLEINTSPDIATSKYAQKKWGMYFDWLFRSETRKPHFNVENPSNNMDYIFNNDELNA